MWWGHVWASALPYVMYDGLLHRGVFVGGNQLGGGADGAALVVVLPPPRKAFTNFWGYLVKVECSVA